jgi:organic hydroperoxide reductase OsmC/OhrA
MTTASTLDAAEPAQAKPRHKSFTFRTSVDWTSRRSGILGAEGKPVLQTSSPPEFKGQAGRWTPEDLFVAAINACMMTTFASFAERLGLPVVSYRSEAEGLLEFVDGGYRFTRVVLRPSVTVADAAALAPTATAIHDAHDACLIGRSVLAEVVVKERLEVARPVGS